MFFFFAFNSFSLGDSYMMTLSSAQYIVEHNCRNSCEMQQLASLNMYTPISQPENKVEVE